jgi:hypothetical protein
MLKIPEEGKLFDAKKFYDYVYSEWHRALHRESMNGEVDPEFVKYGDTITAIIGEFTYDLPPADAKYVVHGKWITRQHDDGYGVYTLHHCSECDCPNANKRNFCPECGAQMEVTLDGSHQ